MISASDRHRAVELIAVAHQAGARRYQACQQLGLTLRTVQRWTTGEHMHADNGSPMKGATLRTTLERLGIVASYSRPRVSNDNPFSEALFRTCKYRPTYPAQGFATLEAARTWVLAFVRWYNDEHRHSGIRFVTPSARHAAHDRAMLQQRQALYEQARGQHPARWSRQTRNWTPVGTVWLNPETSAMAETRHAAGGA